MRSLCVTTREYSLLATTREGPHAATETHCSHEQMKKKLKKKKELNIPQRELLSLLHQGLLLPLKYSQYFRVLSALILKVYILELIQWVHFWLLLFNVMIMRFIHIDLLVNISSILVKIYYFFLFRNILYIIYYELMDIQVIFYLWTIVD